MVAAVLGERRAALERLDHEVVGDVAREAEMDGRVDQGLHHQEDVGRARPADRGGHGHELLVVDLELGPQGLQQRARLAALLLGGVRGGEPDGHPAAQAGGRVGHAPDDPAMAEEALQRNGRRPAITDRTS